MSDMKNPVRIRDLPFIELAYFLQQRFDSTPDDLITPELISEWINEHAGNTLRSLKIELAYRAVSG